MFDYEAYFQKEHTIVDLTYRETCRVIKDIADKTSTTAAFSGENHYREYFHFLAQYFSTLIAIERNATQDYFRETTFESLYKMNRELFYDITPAHYPNSYTNPEYSVEIFGVEMGRLLATFAMEVRQLVYSAYHHERFMLHEYFLAFADGYESYCKGNRTFVALKECFAKPALNLSVEKSRIGLRKRFDPTYRPIHAIIEECDLADQRYLFRYGMYISEYEIQTANFINRLPETKITTLAELVVNAYQTGFTLDNKDLSKKSTVCLRFPIGYERVVQKLLLAFSELRLQVVSLTPTTTAINRQYQYDRRFSNALILGKEYVERSLQIGAAAYELEQENLSAYSGIVLLETFGEPTFQPVEKAACLSYTEEQQMLYQDHANRLAQIYNTYVPSSETSFAMIAFPSPEIGERYKEIFESIYAVNTLEQEEYLQMQERLITILDQASCVLVKGANGNRTEITVALPELVDPATTSNFVNCGADVNIPVGEVFTSPQLVGTNGVLHIGQTYLNGLEYIDLQLTFRDGYIVAYDCKNFEDPAANRKYIEENLLFPHQTLPLGEFAIGTNTLAYAIAQKYAILPILPVLIIEKMGPHFAIGDTCFAYGEDVPVFNPLTKKEMVARDNTKSILRKTDFGSAYTNRHTDITLPYESIGSLTAIRKDGVATDLLRNGRFVVPGLEKLNEPLDRLLSRG